MSLRYGLLGEKLGHSFSKVIHEQLADYTYDLIELPPDQLADFLRQKQFAAINVTIPYKEAVILHLDEVDDLAREIGAVNTIVNQNGRLIGHNTDFDGVKALLAKNGIDPAGKTALVLGTGGTCKTVSAVLRRLGAAKVLVASRSGKNGALTYPEAAAHAEVELVFNTTPCGMYPHTEEQAMDLQVFPKLGAVLDAVYNPLCPHLVQQGRQLGAVADGGLFMLVAQAVRACEWFTGSALPVGTTERVYRALWREKCSIVLIGMPGSGKSTVGKLLAKALDRPFVDMDREIVARAGQPIERLFAERGEPFFRDLESAVCRDFGKEPGLVIATGGGAILRDENLAALRENGLLVFLDRPLADLQTGHGRPLSADADALRRRFEERYDRYRTSADVIIRNDASPAQAVEQIKGVL